MTEYKVMVKSVKDGKWYRANKYYHRGIFKTQHDAEHYAKALIRHEQEKKYPNFSEYKIMTREVSEWTDIT